MTQPKSFSRIALEVAGLLTAFGIISGAGWSSYSHFQTAAKAAEQHLALREEALAAVGELESSFTAAQIKTYKQLKAERIEGARRSIEQLEYQLLDPKLTQQQRDNLKSQIRRLEAYIECVRADWPQC